MRRRTIKQAVLDGLKARGKSKAWLLRRMGREPVGSAYDVFKRDFKVADQMFKILGITCVLTAKPRRRK